MSRWSRGDPGHVSDLDEGQKRHLHIELERFQGPLKVLKTLMWNILKLHMALDIYIKKKLQCPFPLLLQVFL